MYHLSWSTCSSQNVIFTLCVHMCYIIIPAYLLWNDCWNRGVNSLNVSQRSGEKTISESISVGYHETTFNIAYLKWAASNLLLSNFNQCIAIELLVVNIHVPHTISIEIFEVYYFFADFVFQWKLYTRIKNFIWFTPKFWQIRKNLTPRKFLHLQYHKVHIYLMSLLQWISL